MISFKNVSLDNYSTMLSLEWIQTVLIYIVCETVHFALFGLFALFTWIVLTDDRQKPVDFRGLGVVLFVAKLGLSRLLRTISFDFTDYVSRFKTLPLWLMYDLLSSDLIMGIQTWLVGYISERKNLIRLHTFVNFNIIDWF